MDWIYLFASFSGRISRFPFWVCVGILLVVELTGEGLANWTGGDTLSTVLDLAFIYPEFAVAVKRANDRNLSPWIVGLFFAIDAALDLFTLINGPIDPEQGMNSIILLPGLVLGVILLVELGFRRGTEGPNRFGPDPLANTPRQ
jgi:uncharacterized membrane protein YhaH (DUF805 family)